MDSARRRGENESSLPCASAYPGDTMEAAAQLPRNQHLAGLSQNLHSVSFIKLHDHSSSFLFLIITLGTNCIMSVLAQIDRLDIENCFNLLANDQSIIAKMIIIKARTYYGQDLFLVSF